MGNKIRISIASTLIKRYCQEKTRYSISPQFCMLLGNRADFILTNVLGSIASRELCPFKAGNQPGQPNICANDAGIAKKLVSNPLWDCLLLLLRCLHLSSIVPGEGDRILEKVQSLMSWKKLSTATPPKKRKMSQAVLLCRGGKMAKKWPWPSWPPHLTGTQRLQKKDSKVFCDCVSTSALKLCPHWVWKTVPTEVGVKFSCNIDAGVLWNCPSYPYCG